MTRRFSFLTYVLVGMMLLSGPKTFAQGVVTQVDLDNAISKTLGQENAARHTITTLLQRDEVRGMAEGFGLDMRRAEAAAGTLQGDELQRLSAMAANANAELAGGATRVSISLVALLLIIIIVILVVK